MRWAVHPAAGRPAWMIGSSMPICITCLEDKGAADFWGQPKKESGLQAECKICQQQRNRDWKRANAADHKDRTNATISRMRARDPVRALLITTRHRAKKLGREFSITEADIQIPATCPILGIPLVPKMGRAGQVGGFHDDSPSIDRIRNAEGYVPGNVVVISLRANRIKSNATVEELEAIAAFYRGLADGRRREG